MNFCLAWLGAALLPHSDAGMPGIDAYLDAVLSQHPIYGTFLFYFILTNLVLGLFNLIPVPPLDGGRIAVGLLPMRLARAWAQLERAGIVVVLLVVFVLPSLLREFGIRLALGSEPGNLLRDVVTEGVVMAVVGVVVGAGFGLVAVRVAGSYFGDLKMPGVWPAIVSAFVLLGAAVVASILPAARAARVDVMQALRSE